MSQTETASKWKPMTGQMNEAEFRALGIKQEQRATYWAFWFFGRPLIVQQEKGAVLSMAPEVQERALAACGFTVPA
jgi:hypothetical protein